MYAVLIYDIEGREMAGVEMTDSLDSIRGVISEWSKKMERTEFEPLVWYWDEVIRPGRESVAEGKDETSTSAATLFEVFVVEVSVTGE